MKNLDYGTIYTNMCNQVKYRHVYVKIQGLFKNSKDSYSFQGLYVYEKH